MRRAGATADDVRQALDGEDVRRSAMSSLVTSRTYRWEERTGEQVASGWQARVSGTAEVQSASRLERGRARQRRRRPTGEVSAGNGRLTTRSTARCGAARSPPPTARPKTSPMPSIEAGLTSGLADPGCSRLTRGW